jgi:hypothetical protein
MNIYNFDATVFPISQVCMMWLLIIIDDRDLESTPKRCTKFSIIWPVYVLNQGTGIHSVTIKFPNWLYYSNTTNAIYQGWTGLIREDICLYGMQVSICLVDAYDD